MSINRYCIDAGFLHLLIETILVQVVKHILVETILVQIVSHLLVENIIGVGCLAFVSRDYDGAGFLAFVSRDYIGAGCLPSVSRDYIGAGCLVPVGRYYIGAGCLVLVGRDHIGAGWLALVQSGRWFTIELLIQALCRNLDNLIQPILPALSNTHWPAWKGRPTTPACQALQHYGPQSPTAPKESMTKEAALVN